MMRLILLLSICAVAACDAPPEPQPMNVGPLPRKICNEVSEGLSQLSKTSIFEYDAAGEATMPQEGWIPLPPDQKDQIAQLLAFHAACQAKNAPAEQKVVIKSETGHVLLDRIVETRPDLGSLVQD